MEYYTTPENAKATIDEFGVAIIPGLLSKEETDAMMKGTWDYLELVTSEFDVPISREIPKTWVGLMKLFPMNSMLIQHWKAGHAQYVWDLRQNEKITNVFSEIWDTKPQDLLVSFDGVGIHLPPEITGRGWEPGRPGLHCDQSFTRNDFECVQSWVTANDTLPGDATLAFYEKSHLYHKEFAEKFNCSVKSDWYKLNDEENNFFEEKCGKHKSITCPAGSLVLWDSRVIHCGKRPLKTRKSKNIRSVVYLCYTPRRLGTEANLKKKRTAFKETRMTSHWPHKPRLFPVYPRTYGAELPKIVDIPSPKLNDLGKRLAGF